jgi:hypothetical protein
MAHPDNTVWYAMFRKIPLPLLVLAVAAISHITSLPNGFIWIDHNDIEQRQTIIPIESLGSAFMRPFGQTSFYRPIVMVINSIDYAAYGLWAPGYHGTNLLLHLIVVFLTARVLRVVLGFSDKLSWTAACIVGVHPVSAFIVSFIIMRQEAILTIWLLLFLLAYHAYRLSTTRVSAVWCILMACAALFTKESALFLLPMSVLWWELYKKPGKNPAWIIWLLLALSAGGYILMRAWAVNSWWGTRSTPMTIPEAIWTRFSLLGYWIHTLASPGTLRYSDTFPILHAPDAFAITAILSIILIGIVILRIGWKNRMLQIISLLGILIAPALDLIPVPRVASPHYLYMVLVAWSILSLIILSRLPNIIYKMTILIWLMTAGVTSFSEGKRFQNDRVFFTAEVERDPNFAEGQYYLGNDYLRSKDYMKAEALFSKAAGPNKGYLAYRDVKSAKINLAGVKLTLGKLDEADRIYESLLSSASPSQRTYLIYNRALIAYNKGDYGRASDILWPTRNQWQERMPLELLREALMKQGKKAEAEEISDLLR